MLRHQIYAIVILFKYKLVAICIVWSIFNVLLTVHRDISI